jgi:hypothetical protein
MMASRKKPKKKKTKKPALSTKRRKPIARRKRLNKRKRIKRQRMLQTRRKERSKKLNVNVSPKKLLPSKLQMTKPNEWLPSVNCKKPRMPRKQPNLRRTMTLPNSNVNAASQRMLSN